MARPRTLTAVAAAVLAAGCAQPPDPEPPAVAATSHARPHTSRSLLRPRIGTPPVITRPPAGRPTLAPSRRRSGLPSGRGFTAWASSAATRAVFGCESHWNPRAVSSSGKYRGLLQADAGFWATYGGLAYAPRPDLASTGQQLRVGYAGWRARGWQPWTCARIVGVWP